VVRAVSDVETLKALADPTRLAILGALMVDRGGALPVMSVKELAAELGEPQTKLYRHIKHLEAARLIHAVASRVVSGIVEQRYQACQSDLMLGADLTATQKASQEAEATVAAAFDLYRSQFFAARRAGLIGDATPSELGSELYRRGTLSVCVARVPVTRAAAIREELQRIADELNQPEASQDSGEDTITVNVIVGYFTSDQPEQ
jgi:DNA-binding transcriptional ArsR family regulator